MTNVACGTWGAQRRRDRRVASWRSLVRRMRVPHREAGTTTGSLWPRNRGSLGQRAGAAWQGRWGRRHGPETGVDPVDIRYAEVKAGIDRARRGRQPEASIDLAGRRKDAGRAGSGRHSRTRRSKHHRRHRRVSGAVAPGHDIGPAAARDGHHYQRSHQPDPDSSAHVSPSASANMFPLTIHNAPTATMVLWRLRPCQTWPVLLPYGTILLPNGLESTARWAPSLDTPGSR